MTGRCQLSLLPADSPPHCGNSHREAQLSFFPPPCAIQLVVSAKTSFKQMSILMFCVKKQESKLWFCPHFWPLKVSEQQVKVHSKQVRRTL